ncbi:hypothetical protein [Burkholderia cenocepacia]|uniref:hypothetical protein n=1 Tax=Burkholderia cenocepacia TaxID=95486 RepID=UPI0024B67DE3|nr:hypothetical protein [Burkholderia cenocepacia]MDI9686593.1 hypothetical protein [Burkholderia cenocepacia]
MQVLTLRGPAVSHVIETYGNALTELRTYVPDLVLVGGAVRDVYFKRPVKDLDFMSCDPQAARILSEYYKEPITPVLVAVQATYESTRETLIRAYENGAKTINVLLVTEFLAHIALFPDSISQVWTDGKSVFGTQRFNDTAASRVVRYTDRMSHERLSRIHAKYPEFLYGFDAPEGPREPVALYQDCA